MYKVALWTQLTDQIVILFIENITSKNTPVETICNDDAWSLSVHEKTYKLSCHIGKKNDR